MMVPEARSRKVPAMQRNKALTCLASLLTLALGSGSAQALTATPSFTISAANFTMPSSGNGSIPFTLTSVNGYTGTVNVTGTLPNTPAGIRVPNLDLGGPVSPGFVLTANATVAGVIGITASAPAVSRLNLPEHGGSAGWELAGVFILGVGLRRRKARWPMRLLLTAGMLIGLTGIGACGGSPVTLTPGTYPYTLTAYNNSLTASTTVMMTVPPGIVVIQMTGPGPI